ncbi:MerR family transcriptional regulator [Enterococcus malodoratus]|uniref:MerR family transcriptional regulator n=1 Tax=Enterococcus malodoratus TaxID=71451 RepID=UPI0039B02BD4
MYTIGQFSALTGFSIRTLRYYEKINVFHPTYVNSKNNYRYYGFEKFSEISKLKLLRELGFSLEEITYILSKETDEKLNNLLSSRKNRLLKEKENIDSAIFTVNELLERGKGALGNSSKCEEVKIDVTHTKRVIGVEGFVDNSDMDQLVNQLFEKIYSYNCKPKGNMMRVFSDNTPERMKFLFEVEDCDDSSAIEILKGGKYVSVLFKGLYSDPHHAYEKLKAFKQSQNEQFIEEYIVGLVLKSIDDLLCVRREMNVNPYTFLTKVMIKY